MVEIECPRSAGKCRCGICECGVQRHLDIHRDTETGHAFVPKTWHRQTTRGVNPSPEYSAWNNMNRRCHSPLNAAFKDYGGRGITVCSRWRHSFLNFLSDMGPRPSQNHSIDRIDNDKGYGPGNCKWSTLIEQNNNRRACRFITHNGVTRTLTQWANQIGIDPTLLGQRLKRMTFAIAIATPKDARMSHPKTFAEPSKGKQE